MTVDGLSSSRLLLIGRWFIRCRPFFFTTFSCIIIFLVLISIRRLWVNYYICLSTFSYIARIFNYHQAFKGNNIYLLLIRFKCMCNKTLTPQLQKNYCAVLIRPVHNNTSSMTFYKHSWVLWFIILGAVDSGYWSHFLWIIITIDWWLANLRLHFDYIPESDITWAVNTRWLDLLPFCGERFTDKPRI